MTKTIFSSESVAEGHPDKVCDQISDAIVDACLREDSFSRVAAECLVKGNDIVIAGEVTTKASIDYAEVARQVIRDIGYEEKDGFSDKAKIHVFLTQQSPDINMGVSKDDQGAGDQGLMFGYATRETPELMPLPISLAHQLTRRLAFVRKQGILNYLRPDGKSQVSIIYEDGIPTGIHTVVLSAHHDENISQERLRSDLIECVINPVCRGWLTQETVFHINPTGRFAIGGPVADSGLTGRKIIVDTYGGSAPHGGGAFSGKDPSKVDRSAAYACRHIAKNIVASGLADRCAIQVAYAIGISKPVSLHFEFFGTNKVGEDKIKNAVEQVFDLRPASIIKNLNLFQPVYRATACYGHFGRPEFSWEKTDKVDELRKSVQEISLHSIH